MVHIVTVGVSQTGVADFTFLLMGCNQCHQRENEFQSLLCSIGGVWKKGCTFFTSIICYITFGRILDASYHCLARFDQETSFGVSMLVHVVFFVSTHHRLVFCLQELVCITTPHMDSSCVMVDPDGDLRTLLTFLHATSGSSCVASATPLTLWQLVQALARACVFLFEQSTLHKQSSEKPLALRMEALTASLAETTERLGTVEMILEKMHDSFSRQKSDNDSRIRAVESRCGTLDKKLDESLMSMQHDLEKLQRGVEKHALHVEQSFERVDASSNIIRQELLQVMLQRGSSPQDPSRSMTSDEVCHPSSSSCSLGVAVCDSSHGVKVLAVEPASAADRCGLRDGDIILAIGSHPVSSATDIGVLLKGLHEVDRFVVQVFRGTKLHTLICTKRA